MDNRVVAELAHLIRLAESGTAWSEYACWKANAMAIKSNEMSALPALLSNAMNLKKHGPERPSISSRRNK